jgi:hypothetical protein
VNVIAENVIDPAVILHIIQLAVFAAEGQILNVIPASAPPSVNAVGSALYPGPTFIEVVGPVMVTVVAEEQVFAPNVPVGTVTAMSATSEIAPFAQAHPNTVV